MEPRTVQMPPFSVRADLGPRSINEAERTVDLIFTTTTGVRRRDWWTGKEYVEILSMDPAHVRLERMNDGAPLLDSHNAFSTSDILGVVQPGTVSLTAKAMLGTVRFSKDDEAARVWAKVRDGIVRNVSIGYRIHQFEEKPGKTPEAPVIRTAIDWEPFEVSMVPIPADPNAKVRGVEPTDANECVIVTRAQEPEAPATPEPPKEVPTKEQTMQRDQSETIAEPIERKAPAAAAVVTEPNERDAGKAAERERCQAILAGCRAGRLPQSFADALIKDDVPLVEAQGRILGEIGKRDTGAPSQTPRGDGGSVIVGDDPLVHKREGIKNALLHRAFPEQAGPVPGAKVGFALSEVGREYRGLGLMDIAEIFLRARGERITGMNKMERASLALFGRAGMHTTSDFPLLLADVSNKLLRAAYEEAPQTWRPIAQSVPVSDFKSRKMLQLGDTPDLDEILEHGEYTDGTITEGKEELQLKTYGKMFRITRQALINDDLGAFAGIPAAFGRSARRKESDLAWAQITSNPVMGDGVVLFILAGHGNLAAANAAISIESIGIGRAAMRLQKGIDGTSLLSLSPSYLIVPAAKETIADQFVSTNLVAGEGAKVNPFAGRLQVISEPRLDANSETAWYLACATVQAPTLFYGTLDGQEGPVVDQELGFDIDGLKLRCRLDVAFKAADWHAIFKNAGA
jgi:HK97 family phage prohead protease